MIKFPLNNQSGHGPVPGYRKRSSLVEYISLRVESLGHKIVRWTSSKRIVVLMALSSFLLSFLIYLSYTSLLQYSQRTLGHWDASIDNTLFEVSGDWSSKDQQREIEYYNNPYKFFDDARSKGGARIKNDIIFQLCNAANKKFMSYIKPVFAQKKGKKASFFQSKENFTLPSYETVVKNYIKAHNGRLPPPGFDDWYKYTLSASPLQIVENDFIQIYNDLRPFWGIPPAKIRASINALKGERGIVLISIRSGALSADSDIDPETGAYTPWRVNTLIKVLSKFAHFLPDMDIPLNVDDQPRVLVDYETIQEYLRNADLVSPPNYQDTDNPIHEFHSNLIFDPNDPTNEPSDSKKIDWIDHSGEQFMDLATKACPPDSCARLWDNKTSNLAALSQCSQGLYRYSSKNQYNFVHNFNISSDICTVGPHLQNKHGFLVGPTILISSPVLAPIFSECKTSVNNDILFPANMYYTDDIGFFYRPDDDVLWKKKKQDLFWRGVTSGGTQKLDNWFQLHRHRFIQMCNATHLADSSLGIQELFAPSADSTSPNANYVEANITDFVRQHTDVGFNALVWCLPNQDCSYLEPFFKTLPPVPLNKQFIYAYLMDMDGHSFSGRFRAFLQSRSLPFKATLFREWHDSRLFPWVHFVPMDNSFDEIYKLLAYFIGFKENDASLDSDPIKIEDHSALGDHLAWNGRYWARNVLRREDMEIYLFRLMLEYARILDNDRNSLGITID